MGVYLEAKYSLDVYLHELMKGSGVYIKPKPVKTKVKDNTLYLLTNPPRRILSLKHTWRNYDKNKKRENMLKWLNLL